MKREFWPAVLVGFLLLGVLATATLSIASVHYMRKLRALQVEANVANRNLTMFQQLAAETVEYNKTNPNPQIDRILEEVGIKPVTDPSTTPPSKK